jgi:hypothetical protein
MEGLPAGLRDRAAAGFQRVQELVAEERIARRASRMGAGVSLRRVDVADALKDSRLHGRQ